MVHKINIGLFILLKSTDILMQPLGGHILTWFIGFLGVRCWKLVISRRFCGFQFKKKKKRCLGIFRSKASSYAKSCTSVDKGVCQ